jgi:hypothetical protein
LADEAVKRVEIVRAVNETQVADVVAAGVSWQNREPKQEAKGERREEAREA